MTEHRVGLAQRFHDVRQFLPGDVQSAGQQLGLLSAVRQELVQRRVEQPDGHRKTIHGLEDPLEVGPLHGKQLVERAAAPGLIVRHDHLAHRRDALTLEEHVLRAAQADALGAEASRLPRVVRRVGVGAHLQAARVVRPRQDLVVGLEDGRRRGRQFAQHDPHHLAGLGGDVAGEHRAGGPVERQPVAFAHLRAVHREHPVVDVHRQRGAPHHRALAHAARHHGGMAGHPAPRGQHGARRHDAVEVVGCGFFSHQDDVLALPAAHLGDVGVEDGDTTGRARTRRQPGRDRPLSGCCVDDRVQQLVELLRLDAEHRLVPADQSFAHHVVRDAHGRAHGALAGARLEQVERAALDGELEVLHLAEVLLQRLLHAHQFGVRSREQRGHPVDGERRANARHHVLALRVDQKLAIEALGPGGRIARERHARAGVIADIAEHHRHDVDGRTR